MEFWILRGGVSKEVASMGVVFVFFFSDFHPITKENMKILKTIIKS